MGFIEHPFFFRINIDFIKEVMWMQLNVSYQSFFHEILLKVALNTITSHTNLFLFFYIIVVDGQEFAIGT